MVTLYLVLTYRRTPPQSALQRKSSALHPKSLLGLSLSLLQTL
ncbi:hypothetical protein SynA1560_01833 [Synechococcus sp. A15-60]|nr:hypothetical protein SynA1560_01833 [Synechococcus sp. A15-60]